MGIIAKDAVPYLVSLVADHPEIQGSIASALDSIDPNWQTSEYAKRIVPEIIKELDTQGKKFSNSPPGRARIKNLIFAVSKIKDPRFIDPLFPLIKFKERRDMFDPPGWVSHKSYIETVLNEIDPNWPSKVKKKEETPQNIAKLIIELLDFKTKSSAESSLSRIAPDWPKSNAAKEAIPELISTLNGKDSYKKREAVKVMVRIGDPLLVEPLIKALDDNEDLKGSISWALGELGDKRAVKPLEALLEDKNGHIRISAAIALGKLESKEKSVIILSEELKRGNTGAIKGLDDLSPGWRETELKDQAISGILTNTKGKTWQDRSGHISVLEKIDPEWKSSYTAKNIIGFFIGALKEGNTLERESAAWMLGELSDNRCIEPLIDALGDQEKSVRQYAVKSLGIIGDSRAVEPLIKTLTNINEDSFIRGEAAEALGKIGDGRALDSVMGVAAKGPLNNAEMGLESTTLKVIPLVGKDEVDKLIKYMDDPNVRLRRFAARALGIIGDKRAVEPLIEIAINTKLPFTRGYAVHALGEIGDARAVDPLINIFNSTFIEFDKISDPGKTHALTGDFFSIPMAISKIGDERGIALLMELFNNEKRFKGLHPNAVKNYRSKIVSELGEYGTKSKNKKVIKDFLKTALDSEDYGVRDQARAALDRIKSVENIEKGINRDGYDPKYKSWTATKEYKEAISKEDYDIQNEAILKHIESLNDKDPNVRSDAVKALGEYKNSLAAEALVDFMEKEQFSDIRKSAANSLGKIGVLAIEPIINRALAPSGRYPGYFENSAVDALVAIGKDAVDPLIKALKHEEDSVVKYAARALGRIGDPRAIEPLVKTYESGIPRVRRNIVNAFGNIGGKEVIDPLIKALKDSDNDARRSAARILSETGDERAFDPMLEIFNDSDSDYSTRNIAISYLSKVGGKRVEKAFIAYLSNRTDPSYDTRILKTLGTMRSKDSVGLLIPLLNERSETANAAAKALGEIRDPRAIKPLIKALDGNNKESAADALGKFGERQAVEPLIKLLKEENWPLREAVARALSNIRDDRAIEPLIELLNDKSSFVKEDEQQSRAKYEVIQMLQTKKTAIEALGKFDDKRIVDPLIAAFNEDYETLIGASSVYLWRDKKFKVHDIKISVMKALANSKDTRFAKIMIDELSNENPYMKIAAIEALVRLGDKEAEQPLIVALNDELWAVRFGATWALGELGGEKALEALEKFVLREQSLDVKKAAKEAQNKISWKSKCSAFAEAIRNGNSDTLKKLLDDGCNTYGKDSNGFSAQNSTLFVQAVKAGHENVVKILIENGADVDYEDSDRYNALMWAAYKGYENITKMLIENGADVNISSPENLTALMLASATGNQAITSLLIKSKAKLNTVSSNGKTRIDEDLDINNDTALTLATKKGHVETIKVLVNSGADINIKNGAGRSALMESVWNGNAAVENILKKAGGSFDCSDIITASAESNIGAVKSIIDKGCDINVIDDYGASALMVAAIRGEFEIAKLLIDNGADINARDVRDNTPLTLAADNGHLDIVKLLIDNGAELNIEHAPDKASIVNAAKKNYIGIVDLLINVGADLNSKFLGNSNEPNKPPFNHPSENLMMWAIQKDHLETVKTLIKKGADINWKFSHYYRPEPAPTPLIWASQFGHTDIARLLIERGANVNQQDGHSTTPLIAASKDDNNFEVAKLLIESGAHLDRVDCKVKSALMLAVEAGNKKIAKLLIESGAKLDIKRNMYDNKTALIYAAEKGYAELVSLLLKKGANVSIADKEGKTALDYAKEKGFENIVKILKDVGAKE
jgi:HEAT repeat protein